MRGAYAAEARGNKKSNEFEGYSYEEMEQALASEIKWDTDYGARSFLRNVLVDLVDFLVDGRSSLDEVMSRMRFALKFYDEGKERRKERIDTLKDKMTSQSKKRTKTRSKR